MIRRLLLPLLALLLALPALAQGRYSVPFRFTPSGSPRAVAVAGSFNGWSAEATPLADPDGDGTWEAVVELEEGTYTYKFVVDGSAWYPDPAAAESSDDGFGAVNSVVRVGGGQAGEAAEPYRHGSGPRYRNRLPDGRWRVRLRTPPDVEGRGIQVEGPPKRISLEQGWTDGSYRYPQAVLPAGTERYRFVLGDGRRLGSEGIGPDPGWFETGDAPVFVTPPWVPRSVFYQVFPERFANGDPSNDPPGAEAWGGRPGLDNFFGGDLQGLQERLGYLQDLGVGALYLNPVFAAASNHKYDTADYLSIDPSFGDEAGLKALVEEAHRRGIRVILDGVFNHTGTGFFAFRDLEARGEASPYRDWYFVESFPVRREPKPTYKAWWGYASLPKLNTANPEVRRYLLDVGTRWIREAGVDGWRLDVPNEVPHDFWRDFRREVKAARADAYITGEIWEDATPWLQGDQFDGVMNYRFRSAILGFLAGNLDAPGFAAKIQEVLLDYPEQAHGCLLNLLGSHDTPRLATVLPDFRTRDVAQVLQFTLPGTPMVYYGDELGMEGGKDPDCRRCYPTDPTAGQRARRARIRQLAGLRNSMEDLQTGGFEVLHAEGPVLAFARGSAVVAVNVGDRPATLDLPARTAGPREHLSGDPVEVRDGRLRLVLPPLGAALVR